jgi:ubiquinone/menaquinone biosynthesis C-methylase UbiE
VADQMSREWTLPKRRALRLLDPAVGEGELLVSLLGRLPKARQVQVYGFDHDSRALAIATRRLQECRPGAELHLVACDFLNFVSDLPVGGHALPVAHRHIVPAL